MMRTLTAITVSSAICAMIMSGCGRDEEYLDGYEPIQPTTQQATVDRDPVPTTPTAPETPPASASDDPATASFLGLQGPKPESWILEPPPNQMVDTNYRLPAPEGSESANINVFFFGRGMGGPIDDNINRWAGQFSSPDGGPVEPHVEQFEVDNMPVAFVELRGSYQGMGDPEPKPDQIMLSAIIDAPAGRLFIRLVGDAATIEHHREDYMAFLRGLRRVNGE